MLAWLGDVAQFPDRVGSSSVKCHVAQGSHGSVPSASHSPVQSKPHIQRTLWRDVYVSICQIPALQLEGTGSETERVFLGGF